MRNENEPFDYHGVSVTVVRKGDAGDLQYEEIYEIVDHYICNEKGEYLRRLTITIDDNEDITLDPFYSAPAIKRIKEVR